MDRRTALLSLGAVGLVAAAGCVTDGSDDETADNNSDNDARANESNDHKPDESDDGDERQNTDEETMIESAEIETTDVGARESDAADISFTTNENRVVVTGTIETNDVCDDRRVVLEDVVFEDGLLTLSLDLEREQPDAMCRDVLGKIDFEVTITVSDVSQVEDVTVTQA